ncbi:MAG: hypothetical protein DI640_14455 [Sphingomonas taxi]|uniref:Uncharacterized protein n=1 Tax=Sphingomonas taxi TaxID=1549858 RepID=A0A2W4YPC3_9SPHN|nr:MAG: hypothetical protein DI640_14455 [Sphingomonas taxi]
MLASSGPSERDAAVDVGGRDRRARPTLRTALDLARLSNSEELSIERSFGIRASLRILGERQGGHDLAATDLMELDQDFAERGGNRPKRQCEIGRCSKLG